MSHEALVTQSGGEGLATRKGFNGIVDSGSCEAINETTYTMAFLLLSGSLTICVAAGPAIDPNAAIATVAGMLAVSAMALQNALVQVSLHGVPATAVITTNIVRFTTDVGTILLGARRDEVVAARERADRLWPSIAGFITGCCVGAVCEARFGLRALALPAGLALLALAMAAKSNAAEAQVAALSVPDPDRQK